ncbi:hypothetical protein HI914_04536 [Erysiphe necator]|nr:hypothetical protein HI914_04536 [Erysiphe necator]
MNSGIQPRREVPSVILNSCYLNYAAFLELELNIIIEINTHISHIIPFKIPFKIPLPKYICLSLQYSRLTCENSSNRGQ